MPNIIEIIIASIIEWIIMQLLDLTTGLCRGLISIVSRLLRAEVRADMLPEWIAETYEKSNKLELVWFTGVVVVGILASPEKRKTHTWSTLIAVSALLLGLCPALVATDWVLVGGARNLYGLSLMSFGITMTIATAIFLFALGALAIVNRSGVQKSMVLILLVLTLITASASRSVLLPTSLSYVPISFYSLSAALLMAACMYMLSVRRRVVETVEPDGSLENQSA